MHIYSLNTSQEAHDEEESSVYFYYDIQYMHY
jgi:hypothetical protein